MVTLSAFFFWGDFLFRAATAFSFTRTIFTIITITMRTMIIFYITAGSFISFSNF